MYATTIIFQKAFNIHNYGNIKLFREIPWFLTLSFTIYRMVIVTYFRVAGSIMWQDRVCKLQSIIYM